MKVFLLAILIFSTQVFADFVYMQEDGKGKSVRFQKDTLSESAILNDIHSKNWALYPDISADGEEFIYCEGPGQDDLGLSYINPTKKIIQKFQMPEKGMLLHPKFSKNKRWIFYSAPGPKGKNTIFFFDRAAEVARQGESLTTYSLSNAKMIDQDEESYFPRPSSDGNFVVYQRNSNGKKEIIFWDHIENTKKVLALGMSPALSFDERTIAYTVKKNGNWNINTIDRFTGIITEITTDAADEMAPTFTPSGSIVFASNKSGHFRLYEITDGSWKNLVNISESADETELYSPQFSGNTSIKQSERAPFLGNPRSSFGTIIHNGILYMAGGHQGAEHTYPKESFSDQFVAYNSDTNSWTELAPRPHKAHGYQLAANGNYIYAFGGFAFAEEYKPSWKSLDFIDRYDIKENKWETIGKMASPRSSNVAININGKIYLVGGWNSTPKFKNDTDGIFLNSIEIFDLATEKMETANYTLPAPLRRAFTGVNYKGKIILIGGIGAGASHFDLLTNVTSIDPVTGEVQELTPLSFATFAPAAGMINDSLYVFGGMFKTGPMAYEYVSHIYQMNLTEGKWLHTGRFLQETKGFSQVFNLNSKTLGVLGGHHYFEDKDSPVKTFETFKQE